MTQVYFLKKALYSLKQVLQVWYQTFLDFFKKLDFYKIEINHGLFVSAKKTIFITIYMNNLLLFGANIDFRIDDII